MNNIVIEVDGGRFDGWTHVSVSKSIENLCGNFRFTGTASELTEFPVKVGQECQIFVNDVLFMTGYAEKTQVELSAFNHVITISGRDITSDVVDSQLGHIDFNPKTNLKSITEKVLEILNLKDKIKVIDNFNLKDFTDIETEALGTTAFHFIESYAKKRQVLLSTNGEGDIVFIRAGKAVNNTILSTKGDTAATLLKVNVMYDNSKRFNEYVCMGQAEINLLLSNPGIEPDAAATVQSTAFDSEIRNSRKYVFQPEKNGTTGDNEGRALWEANYRKSNSMIYRATVQGFKPLADDGLWDLNTLVHVVDDFSNINDTESLLLITEIEYIEDLNEGTITNLKLMNRDSFTTIVNQPDKDKKDFKEGPNLKLSNPGTSSQ